MIFPKIYSLNSIARWWSDNFRWWNARLILQVAGCRSGSFRLNLITVAYLRIGSSPVTLWRLLLPWVQL